MYQKGVLVICGDVDAGIGDSMYAGDIFVGGDLGVPGSDCVEQELTADDEALLADAVRAARPRPEARVDEARLGREAAQLRSTRVRDLAGGDVTERDAIEARRWLHHHAVWTPDVIQDIQLKAELGRYRYRGMSTTRPVPNFDDLTFLPCTLSRVPLEGYRERCETRDGARHALRRAAAAR